MRSGRYLVLASMVLAFGAVVGCGGGESDSGDVMDSATKAVEDAGNTVTDAAAEAAHEIENLSVDDLKAKVTEVTDQIMAKEGELQDLQAKIKEIKPADLMGDGAKAMKEKAETLTTEIASLKDKLTAYTDKMMAQ